MATKTKKSLDIVKGIDLEPVEIVEETDLTPMVKTDPDGFNADLNYDVNDKKKWSFNEYLKDFNDNVVFLKASETEEESEKVKNDMELILANMIRQYRLYLQPENDKVARAKISLKDAKEQAVAYANKRIAEK